MKSARFLLTLISSLLLGSVALLPAFALAEDSDSSVSVEMHASTSAPRREPPRPGVFFPSPEKIREVASSTRAFLPPPRPMATSSGMRPGMMGSSTMSVEARMEMRARLDGAGREAKDQAENAMEKAKAKFGAAVQTSVGNITNSLTRSIENLLAISDRVDARINELQAKGVSMDASVVLLAQANSDINKAQIAITDVGYALQKALSNATPKAEVPKIRLAVKTAEDAIRTAKESLQKTLDSVRAASQAQVQTSTNASITQ